MYSRRCTVRQNSQRTARRNLRAVEPCTTRNNRLQQIHVTGNKSAERCDNGGRRPSARQHDTGAPRTPAPRPQAHDRRARDQRRRRDRGVAPGVLRAAQPGEHGAGPPQNRAPTLRRPPRQAGPRFEQALDRPPRPPHSAPIGQQLYANDQENAPPPRRSKQQLSHDVDKENVPPPSKSPVQGGAPPPHHHEPRTGRVPRRRRSGRPSAAPSIRACRRRSRCRRP